jgi:hypothetical protein
LEEVNMKIRYETRTSIGKATRFLSVSTNGAKCSTDGVVGIASGVVIVVLALVIANAAGALVPAMQVVTLMVEHLAAVAR